MAAFDLNNLYLIKGNKPKTTSYEELSGMVDKGFNLGTAAKTQYDKNSLQNLIAQRESEGIPYYMLGNEAAKWNLDAANGMTNLHTSLVKNQYEMDQRQFTEWRKTMARRICGKILQIAEQMGMQPDQLADVLEVAYSYVVTYDPDLANQLLARANAIRSTKARADKPAKEVKDHEKEISGVIDKMKSLNEKDLQSNPRGWAEGMIRGHAGGALQRYKYATGNNIWLRQLSMLEQAAYVRFPGWENGGEKASEAVAWLDGVSPNVIEAIVGDIDQSAEYNENNVIGENDVSGEDKPQGKTSASVPKNADSGSTEGVNAKPKEFSYPVVGRDASRKKYPINGDKIQDAIDEADSVEYLKSIRRVLQKGVQAWRNNDNDSKQYDDFISQIDKKLNSMEEGGFSPEARKALKLDGKTTEQKSAESARWMRIPTLIKGYYTNAGALLPAMVRAILPEERTTDQDVKRVLLADLGGDQSKVDALFNAIAASNDGELSALLKKEGYEQAIRSIAPIVMDKMKSEYNALISTKGNTKESVNEALKEVYSFDDEVLKYLSGELALQKDKKRYKAIQKKKEAERDAEEKAAFDREVGNNERNYTDEDWN